MPFAVTLLFDPPATQRLAMMRRLLAEGFTPSDPGENEYAPHLTLAVYPEDTPTQHLRSALRKLAAAWKALPVSFSGFGIFPGPPPILWAAPVVTPALLARHSELRGALSGFTPDEHFAPDAWAPHVTLSATLADPAAALRALLPLWRPLSGQLATLQLVHFRPVEVLETHVLPL